MLTLHIPEISSSVAEADENAWIQQQPLAKPAAGDYQRSYSQMLFVALNKLQILTFLLRSLDGQIR